MTIEFRRHPGNDSVLDFHGQANSKTLPLVCPSCQNAISLSPGLCGNRLVQAILLQSQRIGTELECNSCGLRFVFHRAQNEAAIRGNRAVRDSLTPMQTH